MEGAQVCYVSVVLLIKIINLLVIKLNLHVLVSFYFFLFSQLKKTVEELNDALATKEEIAQRCRELDLQVRLLQ